VDALHDLADAIRGLPTTVGRLADKTSPFDHPGVDNRMGMDDELLRDLDRFCEPESGSAPTGLDNSAKFRGRRTGGGHQQLRPALGRD
jgi:hypothetical protein